MTPSEKAQETRKLHREAQRAKERERKETREKMKKGCLMILDDPDISSGERLEALRLLNGLLKER